MSRFSSSSSGVRLDAAGNIDTNRLEKELRSALDFDVKYKQTDNMKKKACKVSGTYDEFKAMVACAHLKTLTSKEVQSLATAKKGWQKTHVADTSAAALILQQEQRELEASTAPAEERAPPQPLPSLPPSTTFIKPSNGLALERDMQRLQDVALRWSYLQQVGLKRIKTLLKGDAGIDIFEQTLLCVMSEAAGIGEGAAAAEGEEEGEGEDHRATIVFKWLKAISSFDRFGVSIHFIPPPLLADIQAWLAAFELRRRGKGRKEEPELDAGAVLARYCR